MSLSKTRRPNVIFLSETRKNKEYVESLHNRLGIKNVFIVSVPPGKGRGVAVFWDDLYTLELNKYGDILLACTSANKMALSGKVPLSMVNQRRANSILCGIC